MVAVVAAVVAVKFKLENSLFDTNVLTPSTALKKIRNGYSKTHNITKNKSCVWRPLFWWVYRLRKDHHGGQGQSVTDSIETSEDQFGV